MVSSKTPSLKQSKMNELVIKKGNAFLLVNSEKQAYDLWNIGYSPYDKEINQIELADDLDTAIRTDGYVLMMVSNSIDSYDMSREMLRRGFVSDVFHINLVEQYNLSHSGSLQLLYDALVSEQVKEALVNTIESLATKSKRYKTHF